MIDLSKRSALLVGSGPGISAAVARGLAREGVKVGLSARDTDKLASLATEIGAERYPADASRPDDVELLFDRFTARFGEPDIVVYNASARVPGPLADLDPDAVRAAIDVTAFGGFLVVRQAARRMVPRGTGTILLTGATASVKGFAHSAAFAMGKFALRGLAQSAARELGPKGIHVAHVVVDGAVRSERRPDPAENPDSTLSPEGVAQTYLDLVRQPRDAWSFEVEVDRGPNVSSKESPVPISMYDASVPVFVRSLAVLSDLLDKGGRHAGTAATDLVQARLAPDMLTLAGQVQRASDSAKFGAARLTGSVAPSFEDNEATIDELRDRCARTISYLRDLAPDAFTDCETRTVTFGGAASKRTLPGAAYLLTFAVPNFFFHVATAYDVLRQEGVPIGKRDYLGLT